MIKFLKEYYRATNRKFSDKIIWSPGSKAYEKAWQKGQHAVSKLERRFFIAIQYICLLGSIVVSLIKPEIWFCSLIGIGVFVLDAMLTKFSFVWILFLALVLKRNTIYSKILYNSLFEDMDLSLLTKMTKKHVSGYACVHKDFLKIKYKAISKLPIEIYIVFKHNVVCLSIGEKKIKINENYANEEKLFSKISEEIVNYI